MTRIKRSNYILYIKCGMEGVLVGQGYYNHIKYHKLDGSNNRYLFITVLEAEKSKINAPAYLVPGEVPLDGLQMANFFTVPPHGQESRDLLCHFF